MWGRPTGGPRGDLDFLAIHFYLFSYDFNLAIVVVFFS